MRPPILRASDANAGALRRRLLPLGLALAATGAGGAGCSDGGGAAVSNTDHPNAAENQLMADQLTAEVRARVGWSP